MLKKVEKIHAGMSLDGTGCHKVSPRESHKQVVAIVPRFAIPNPIAKDPQPRNFWKEEIVQKA
eukprot:3317110-Amphidinium_carterae.1